MPEQPSLTGAVFLSYASEDADAAARICEALCAAGVEVWLDKNELRGGDAWDAHIRKRIHECALFIPVISANTNTRNEGYFRREWKQATRRLQDMADDVAFLVPVVIDETREQDARVPEEFLSAQWTWLRSGETSPAFARRVRELLGLDPAPSPMAKAAATGVLEPSERRHGSARPRGTPPMRRFAIPFLALLLVLGGAALWYFQDAGDAPATEPVAAAAPSATAVAPNDKSIAVLPFVNMSPDKDQEYFADGIAEELLNLLAQVPDLKVIARTSSFAFKGEKIEIAEIARKLNVAHVLEGSVRKSGNQLRITAQLVRASDSTHLWSQTYDRPMTDVFTVQDEIANAIVQALQIQLAGGELNRRKGGTQNLEAYQLYLHAKQGVNENTRASLEASEQSARRAVEIDPGFGLGWDTLSEVALLKAENGFVNAAEGFERTKQYALQAQDVSPDLATAKAHLGYSLFARDWNWAAAEVQFKAALALDPTDFFALNNMGRSKASHGRWEEAERYFTTALARDPLNPYLLWNLGHTYYLARRFEDSERVYRRLLASTPDFGWTRGYLGKTLVALGRAQEGLELAEQDAEPLNRLTFLPVLLRATGRRAEADAALAKQVEVLGDQFPYYVAQTYAHRGDADRAFEWLERAYVARDSSLIEIVGEPFFDALAEDPRYKAFLRKMNLPVDAK